MQAFEFLQQGMEAAQQDGQWSLRGCLWNPQLLLPMLLAGLNGSLETQRAAALNCLLALPKVCAALKAFHTAWFHDAPVLLLYHTGQSGGATICCSISVGVLGGHAKASHLVPHVGDCLLHEVWPMQSVLSFSIPHSPIPSADGSQQSCS